jgi:membrane protein YdbS with pleckstrin-like domain
MLTPPRALGMLAYMMAAAAIEFHFGYANWSHWAQVFVLVATMFPAGFFAPELFGLREPRQTRDEQHGHG